MYTESRNALHAAEFADAAPEQVAKLFSDTLALKEDLAYHALRKYKQAGSPSVFISDIKGELETHPAAQEDALRAAVNDTFIGAYILPLSTREDTPSPIESIAASARNLEIAGAYIAAAQDSDVAMLLSGSSAWGTFFAPKGGVPAGLEDYDIQPSDPKEISDVDIICVGENIDNFKTALTSFIANGLVPESEQERFKLFSALYASGKADIFSLRSYAQNVEQSLHFIPAEVFEAITNGKRHHPWEHPDGHMINTVRDFRPNIPKNVRQSGGYPISDLRGMAQYIVEGQVEAVHDHEGIGMGYISRSPIGCATEIKGEPTFLLGIMSFFAGIYPIIMHDPKDKLPTQLARMHATIKNGLNGNPPTYVTRQDRMPKRILHAVKNALS